MKRKLGGRLLVGVLVGLMVGTVVSAQTVELYVAAAASLKDVAVAIQRTYQQKRPNVKLLFNFASSGALQTQIEQGAPADLFIAAAPKQMDALEQQGLVKKATRRKLLENQLVLIIPQNTKLKVKNFQDLTNEAVQKIGIGAPKSVPAGQYAQAVLESLKLAEKLQGKLVLGTNVRTVLTYVETGNVDAGVVYRTDASSSRQVKIVAAAPPGSHEPIIYPAAVLTHSKQPQAATEFIQYLSGKQAERIFAQYGFMKAR